MQKIFWKSKRGKTIAATETPFKTEDEFERFILDTQEILSGIVILKRQVRAGKDILDMVGVDDNNCAVIIENKNELVGEDILPQIMRYAVWAETHQDTIRLWWREADATPDGPEIDWERLQIRLVVLAPSIKPTVPRLVKKLGYAVDLIEIKKFVVGSDEIIVVNQLELPVEEGRAIAKGMAVYDKEYYKERRNSRSVDAFFRLQAELERIVKSKGWNLEPKINSYYTTFKHGSSQVFGVSFSGTKSFGIYVRLPKNKRTQAKRLCPYPLEDSDRSLWIPVNENLKANRLISLLHFAYDSFVGEHPAD
jgi:hypothetical protein